MKTQRFFFAFLLSLTSFWIAACGGSSSSSTQAGETAEYTLQSEVFAPLGQTDFTQPKTKAGQATLSGSGALVHTKARALTDNNFALEFSLEENGSLTLVTNAESNLTNGVNLTFSRVDATDQLKLKVSAAGKEYEVNLNQDLAVKADGLIKLSVDVHAHGHVVIWDEAGTEFEDAFVGPIEGKRWGLRLNKAQVVKATPDSAKDIH